MSSREISRALSSKPRPISPLLPLLPRSQTAIHTDLPIPPMASRLLASRLRLPVSSFLRSTTHHHQHPSPPPPRQPPPLNPNPHHFLSSLPSTDIAGGRLQYRLLSTFSDRRPISRSRAADIGARARQLQNRRLWTYALTFGCIAGFVVIVLATFQDQLVFYLTPTDAVARFASDPSKNRLRLGGLVLEGSVIHPSPSSPEMEFVVTDLLTDVLVRYEGSLPDLFREGHSVVVEGFLRPFTEEVRAAAPGKVSAKAREGECFLKATEVLAKHDEKYMPKEVAEALEKNKKKLEAEAAAAAISVAAADGDKATA